uniref:Magnesium transporter n=1 Tax=Prasinoderma singulare TaxID=676789 RepID=A0A7S3BNU4_9VIRI|mmetsp:Transcript_19661/g.61053  ORF Transcript_19661/g.61053 Transcript_19661/m.61053 type:complete len:585 (+) Transcript_19661:104-1858(+)
MVVGRRDGTPPPPASLRRVDTPAPALRPLHPARAGSVSDELGAAGGVRDVLGGVAGAPPARGRASSDAGGSGVSALLGKARKGRIPQNYSFDDLALKVYGDAARAPAAPRGLMGGAPGGGGGGMPSGSGGESATSTVGGSAPRRSGQRTWIVFEPSGTVRRYTADRHRLVRRLAVPARDLRVLDPAMHTPAAILCREKALVVNLGFIRMVLCADQAYLLFSGFDDMQMEQVRGFADTLRQVLQGRSAPAASSSGQTRDSGYASDGDLSSGRGGASGAGTGYGSDSSEVPHSNGPSKLDRGIDSVLKFGTGSGATFRQRQQNYFEFRVLEAALERVVGNLERETAELETSAYPALDKLTFQVTSSNLDTVRLIKGKMNRLHNRATQFRDELEQLLANDDDMNEMYLTRKLVAEADESVATSPFPGAGKLGGRRLGADESEEKDEPPALNRQTTVAMPTAFAYDVEEIEDLLETFNEQILAVVYKLSTLREYIDDTEDYIAIMQDSHRNRLIQMDLIVTCGTFCLTIYNVVGALFGMNIPNPLGGVLNEGEENFGDWYAITWSFLGLSLVLFVVMFIFIKKRAIVR